MMTLVAALAFWLMASERGTRVLLTTVAAQFDGQADQVSGTLLRGVRAAHFSLSLPGVVTGCIFVFVPSLGNFVVPELLGGGKTVMVGNLVRDQFLKARDWPFGATLALFMVVLLLPVYFAFTGLRTAIGLLSGPTMWSVCAVVLLVAIVGKLGGTAVAALRNRQRRNGQSGARARQTVIR